MKRATFCWWPILLLQLLAAPLLAACGGGKGVTPAVAGSAAVGPPAVSLSLLKRLGVPPFWKAHPEIRGALGRLYAKVTERAMALAYGGPSSRTNR